MFVFFSSAIAEDVAKLNVNFSFENQLVILVKLFQQIFGKHSGKITHPHFAKLMHTNEDIIPIKILAKLSSK